MSVIPDRVEYRSWMSDNLRWDALQLRDGDIVISTPPKCGTTWTQWLISLLIFDGPHLPGPLPMISPWLDLTVQPIEHVAAALDRQDHRRFIKTHTPLDGLVLDDRVTYVCVGRDPRDAAVSMMMEQDKIFALHETAGPRGAPPPSEGPYFAGEFDPLEVLNRWLERPAAPLEGMASLATILQHFGSVWDRRQEPNVAVFHYADFRADLVGEFVRLAQALGYDLGRDRAAELAEHATLDVMRARAADIAPKAPPGAKPRHESGKHEAFFRSGGRGEWREIFTEAEHRRYAERVAELAPSDLLAWAHEGRKGCDPNG